jgi:oligopeptide/dipeptide ABC transporter ATP-binding protein
MLSGGLSEAPFKAYLRAIPGAAPPLDARPAGCRFHPRCLYAQEDCRARLPELRAIRTTQAACKHPLAGAAA